ncbi:MAG: flagellar hook-associated protein FlgK [Rhodobacteraceae bacterium]|nr:flagellar hook-associated protein FlgK [Paracoccaceae bacterium]
MTLTSALSNALSGMSAASRSADVTASNISNAMTDGYRRREVEVMARWQGSGGGVQIVGIQRHVDQAVLQDRRGADAELANIDAQTGFLSGVESEIGLPGETGSLSDRLAKLDAALTTAIGRPESETRLDAVVDGLKDVTSHLGEISEHIQSARARADKAIATDVALVNETLARVEDLNGKLRRHVTSGDDISGLLDQRQELVDTVAEIIPVRELDRGNGVIALMTPQGGLLLDGPAVELSFTPANAITADLSLSGGTLSGISIDGVPVDLAREPHRLSGGRLAGNLDVRDSLGPEAQARLDAVARDLIERFADPAVDPTLGPTDPGLLTDAGAAFDPLTEAGIAGRIAVNAAVDPASGGELWRLRDGLLAAVEGPVGNASGLTALSEALSVSRVPASGGYSGAARSAQALSADMLSSIGGTLQSLETDLSFVEAQRASLKQIELENGVDTDQELQKLLLIEQAYAANARVIQTVDSLFETLMRI